ncbi:MAG: hypothetical protein QXO72_04950 [Sulfolobales archaeon]
MVDCIKAVVKIDNKGRVTIPQHIREPLGIGLGMYFEVVADLKNRQVVLKPLFKGRTEGLVDEVKVMLEDLKELGDLIKTCVGGGYDIISLNCIYGEKHECVLNIYAIDDVQVNKLKELLEKYAVSINF